MKETFLIDFILWSGFVSILGWIVFPILFHFFKKTTEGGYSVSKIFGLLVWGYIFWIGNIFGIISNNQPGVIFAFVILFFFSLISFLHYRIEIKEWIKENIKIILIFEIIYLLLFFLWSIVRTANPELIGTEKPMELAFINGIHQSPNFPPNDPWLSGYSISYYYFGYLLVSMLMHLWGTSAGSAFNLTIALWFSLIGISAAGVLHNLILAKSGISLEQITFKFKKMILLICLLAPLFILIIGNAVGLLEMMHSRGLFWDSEDLENPKSSFWNWLDIKELHEPPTQPFDWNPSRQGGIWWWRASRVLQDYTINGQPREIIDEFPFFTFLLADLHPHVMAIPFVILAIYISVYIFVVDPQQVRTIIKPNTTLRNPLTWLFGFAIGSLIFINTWDFPIYFLLAVFCVLLISIDEEKKILNLFSQITVFTIQFGLICIVFYLPFLLSLSSQASGLLPSLVFKTRAIHYLVMFFPHIGFLLIFFLIQKNNFSLKNFARIFISIFLIALFLLMTSIVYSLLIEKLPLVVSGIFKALNIDTFSQTQPSYRALQEFLNIYGANNIRELAEETIQRVFAYPLVIIFLIAVISYAIMVINLNKQNRLEKSMQFSRSDLFIFIIIIFAASLSIFPEFYYLRDQFGWRMNTIFKFYFQVWILYSFVSAYAIYKIILLKDQLIRRICIAISILLIVIGLIYPFFAIRNKTNDFMNINLSLDGNKYFSDYYPLEYEAVIFLRSLEYGVISEAVGGSYTNFGRISRLTGFPTVLGWTGHELQWRGGMNEIGSREQDIKTLYSSPNWEQSKAIIDLYNIDYVFIGDLERRTYQIDEEKFIDNMTLVFNNSSVIIYSSKAKL